MKHKKHLKELENLEKRINSKAFGEIFRYKYVYPKMTVVDRKFKQSYNLIDFVFPKEDDLSKSIQSINKNIFPKLLVRGNGSFNTITHLPVDAGSRVQYRTDKSDWELFVHSKVPSIRNQYIYSEPIQKILHEFHSSKGANFYVHNISDMISTIFLFFASDYSSTSTFYDNETKIYSDKRKFSWKFPFQFKHKHIKNNFKDFNERKHSFEIQNNYFYKEVRKAVGNKLAYFLNNINEAEFNQYKELVGYELEVLSNELNSPRRRRLNVGE